MNMSNEAYKKYADGRAKKSPILKDSVWAFFTGGAICTVGHALKQLYLYLGAGEENAGMLASVTLVFAAILLTGIGVFDNIAKHAGAGTLVPITGFANAVSSCAIDTKSEGFILGVGAKIFTIAGPVILYGISAGVVYGVIYWMTTLF
ncbi:MAG: SpoVA/SpoVAEb family sporulation membrane protein [Clostridia bacterium]|nr:SpoVA/SpoVAEb family sporulation membrane protein [Clostridia bacterium]